jgi:hypothetical protein
VTVLNTTSIAVHFYLPFVANYSAALNYKYTCRDWPVMIQRRTEGITNGGLIRCWDNPQLCPTLGCHNKLRDQSTLVEIDTFNETWTRIAEALKSIIVSENPDERTCPICCPFQHL